MFSNTHPPPTNLYVEILTSSVMALGAWGFEKWLAPKRALMSGIDALVKDNSESSLTPSTMWGCNVKVASYGPGSKSSPDKESASALILDFLRSPSLKNCGK